MISFLAGYLHARQTKTASIALPAIEEYPELYLLHPPYGVDVFAVCEKLQTFSSPLDCAWKQ
jgi:hypothetical protein